MFIQPHDRVDDETRWRAFLVAQGFGHLVASCGRDSYPVAVPTQFVLDGDALLMHVVALNPIIPALAENAKAVLSVAGDWAFIPGAWKAIGGEDPRKGIPTTYYAAVQVMGTCTVDDPPTRWPISSAGNWQPSIPKATTSIHSSTEQSCERFAVSASTSKKCGQSSNTEATSTKRIARPYASGCSKGAARATTPR
jgi:hypothetical protein